VGWLTGKNFGNQSGAITMKIHIYVPKENDEHIETLEAMASGIPGAEIRTLESYRVATAPDVAVVFGVYKRAVPQSYLRGRVLEIQRYLGKRTLVLEKGYINRDEYFSAGWEGLNNRANFLNCGMDDHRSSKLGVELQPWDLTGDYHMVVGQVPWDASVENTNFFLWVADAIIRTKRITDIPIKFRQHPKAEGDFSEMFEEMHKNGVDVIPGSVSLEESIASARSVITYNSNVGVDALVAGKPVLSFDEGSMVWQATRHHVEYLLDPGLMIAGVDRQQWLNDIAYAQWSREEMASGAAWNHLFQAIRENGEAA
jgi:hypothetical protein